MYPAKTEATKRPVETHLFVQSKFFHIFVLVCCLNSNHKKKIKIESFSVVGIMIFKELHSRCSHFDANEIISMSYDATNNCLILIGRDHERMLRADALRPKEDLTGL